MNSAILTSFLATEVSKDHETFVQLMLKMIGSWFNDPIFVFVSGITLLALFFWYLGSDNDRVKRNAGTCFIIGIVSFCMFALFSKGINYGIDIQGGVSFTLEVQPKEVDGQLVMPSPDSMQRAVDTVRERIDSTGAKEPIVMAQGTNKILVQVPATAPDQIDELRKTITQIAHLELLPVHPDSDRLVSSGQQYVLGWKLYDYVYQDDDNVSHTQKLFLSKRVTLTGSDVSHAQPDPIHPGIVNVTLSSAGGDKMTSITQAMQKGKDRLAVVLDGKVVTAPVVQSTLSRNFQISGMNAPGEADRVSRVLNNPLEAPLVVLEQRTVSPTLGETALVQGETAGVYGIILIFIMMFVYYRFGGIVAMVALLLNSLILLGCMSLFDFTLTLPGIAGIILTLGVAVDANVLIYERLREELESKQPISRSLRTSFDKAFSAIFDSNITSLLTALILFWLASGSIKGFAVTTTVGLLSSMIGALVVSRVLFYWATKFHLVNDKMKFLNVFKKTNFNFLGLRKFTLTLSVLIIIATFVAGAIRGKSALGIDFTGGATISYNVPSDKTDTINFQDIVTVVKAIPNLTQSPSVQEFKTLDGNTTIAVNCATDDLQQVTNTLNKQYKPLGDLVASQGAPSNDIIGPVLGKEFMIGSLIALGAGFIGIFIYLTIRFEWAFSLGALVAIFFNVAAVMGAILISGGQFALIHVGAILTIVGYSVNDTIVIFDRIREVLQDNEKQDDPTSLMNLAINSTLSRTILTSGSTLAAVICLWAFGGPSMKDFSFAIIVGVCIGTFTSIFVASPIVLICTRKRGLHSEVSGYTTPDTLTEQH